MTLKLRLESQLAEIIGHMEATSVSFGDAKSSSNSALGRHNQVI